MYSDRATGLASSAPRTQLQPEANSRGEGDVRTLVNPHGRTHEQRVGHRKSASFFDSRFPRYPAACHHEMEKTTLQQRRSPWTGLPIVRGLPRRQKAKLEFAKWR